MNDSLTSALPFSPSPLKLGILVSGQGSNMLAIAKACEKQQINAKVAIVISNNIHAPALKKAQFHNIPSLFLENEEEIIACLLKNSVDLVCLAGYMKIISARFLQSFPEKIINIHPSLLPQYKGLNTHQRVLEAGESESGCTVHYVDEGIDTGKIMMQTKVPILPTDTAESLQKRILVQEHQLYCKAIQALIAERSPDSP